MSLSDLLTISITSNTKSPTQPGFGTPLIAAYHTHNTDRVRSYSSTSAMVTDGFTTTEPAYLAATVAFAQNPAPPNVMIGRRALPTTQVLQLVCTDSTQGDVYSFKVGLSGVPNTITYTVLSSATTTTVATAIAALITALSLTGVVVTHSTATITLTQTAGVFVDVQPDVAHMTFTDASTDPGIATDLAAIQLANPNWYGLALDSQSSAEIAAAAVWVEANQKLFVPNNSDTINGSTPSGDTTSIAAVLQTHSYACTGVLFAQSQLLCYSGLGWMAQRLTAVPGSDNWAYKTIAGVPYDNLTETVYSNVLTKNANVYVVLASIGCTFFGTAGGGSFLDTTRFLAWLSATIQINLFSQLINSAKVPYTDAGVYSLCLVILSVLAQGVRNGGLIAGTTSVTAQPVASVSQANVLARNYPSITFAGQLAGAINKATVAGTVSVP